MSPQEQHERANSYISKCVVDGMDELKRMLGLDQPVQGAPEGEGPPVATARQVHIWRKRPKGFVHV